MAKIVDNPSTKNLLEQISAFGSLEELCKALPFVKHLFPGVTETTALFEELKKQAEILFLPDQFNQTFSKVGWIAYESMNLDTMLSALRTEQDSGLAASEQVLADYYNEETLNFGMMRFSGHVEFRRRLRLLELAKDDYLARRFHACVPLLLSLLDGIANDISKHVGFFAEGANMTAWDRIAAHQTGLGALVKIMSVGRNKTNEEPIGVPFRNGILHGRELAFDNQIVAAKCWSALFAVRDWAAALSDGRLTAKPKQKTSWSELFTQIAETQRRRKALDAWKAREALELPHLPCSGPPISLPANTPERAVAEFLENWCKGRFGLMAEALLDFSTTPKGKKSGDAKKDFGACIPISFNLNSVTDQAAAISQVEAEVVFKGQTGPRPAQVNVRTVYIGTDNGPAVRGFEGGSWKIVQNSFSEVLYRQL